MSSIFGKPSVNVVQAAPTPAPPAPTPSAPVTMPDLFGPASLQAARKATADAAAGGRSSTILTTAASRAALGTIAGKSGFTGTVTTPPAAGAYGSAKLGGG